MILKSLYLKIEADNSDDTSVNQNWFEHIP